MEGVAICKSLEEEREEEFDWTEWTLLGAIASWCIIKGSHVRNFLFFN